MPSIVFSDDSFKKELDLIQTNQTNRVLFRDVNLNLVSQSNTNNSGINRKDIFESINLEAIKNSIFNILNIRKNERLLVPRFGTNLAEYLFEPISEDTAELIGEEVQRALETWEPRINIEGVFVNIVMDKGIYEVLILLSIPSLESQTYELLAEIDEGSGFIVNHFDLRQST